MAALEMFLPLMLAQSAGQPAEAVQPAPEQVENRDYASEPIPIVVTGETDTTTSELVIVGSRIPRKPLHPRGQFATNTALHGLTPGSGMDPMGAYTRTLQWSECRASDPIISEKAACLLVAAQKDFTDGDRDGGIAVLRSLALSESFSAGEQLEAIKRLYAEGERSADDTLRVYALELMLENTAFPRDNRAAALRTVAAIALRDGDEVAAIAAFAKLDSEGKARAQELANLAVLQRRSGDDAAKRTMERAIAMRLSNGLEIPPGWEDFTRIKN